MSSHPFGDLITQYLSRKHGLSQSKLAEGILQDPAVISRMCKGERLTGPQARERVVGIIGWFYNQRVLTTVVEANALLEAAGMARLNANISEEAQLIHDLIDESTAGNVSSFGSTGPLASGDSVRPTSPPLPDASVKPPESFLIKVKRQGWVVAIIVVVILVVGLIIWSFRPDQSVRLDDKERLAAIIIGVEAETDVKRQGTDRLIPAKFGLALAEGDVVNTYDNATVTIICENGLLFNLPEQNNLTVDCQDTSDERLVGQLDPTLSSQLLNPSEIVPVALESTDTRTSRLEQTQTPLLLSPRNTLVADTRPTFHWQPVSGASGYRLLLNLASGESWSRETTETSLPYPADAPPLSPNSVNVVLLSTLDDEEMVDKTLLRVPDEASLTDLTEAEAAIQALELDEAAQGYLLAQLYRQWEMWAAAIAQLEELLLQSSSFQGEFHEIEEQETEFANVWQQLGDLNTRVALYAQAEDNYKAALTAAKSNIDPTVEAIAHIGLARVAQIFTENDQALDHLMAAEELYRQTGQIEQAERIATERTRLTQ